MYMSGLSINIMPIIIALLVLTIGVVAYFFIYKKRVNRAVTEGGVFKRRMMSPSLFAVILIIGILLVYGIYSTVINMDSNHNNANMQDKYLTGHYDFDVYNASDMEGYLSVYSLDDNPGYTKYTEEKGDIRFTYFIREDEYDTYHPSFLIYVQYTGEKDIKNRVYDGKFLTDTDEVICGLGAGGEMTDEYFAVIGNTDTECIFSFQAALYDTYAKYENIGDGATAYETIRFCIP